jgi:hypothetical protein
MPSLEKPRYRNVGIGSRGVPKPDREIVNVEDTKIPSGFATGFLLGHATYGTFLRNWSLEEDDWAVPFGVRHLRRCKRAVGAYFEREADSPKLLEH